VRERRASGAEQHVWEVPSRPSRVLSAPHDGDPVQFPRGANRRRGGDARLDLVHASARCRSQSRASNRRSHRARNKGSPSKRVRPVRRSRASLHSRMATARLARARSQRAQGLPERNTSNRSSSLCKRLGRRVVSALARAVQESSGVGSVVLCNQTLRCVARAQIALHRIVARMRSGVAMALRGKGRRTSRVGGCR
jgi:hypothetical protein